MPIPEDQLERWSHQGATVASARAYAAVKNAIDASPLLTYRQVEVYLQGSYRNDTNIRGDSDVDIVVQSHATFIYDVGRLQQQTQWAVSAAIPPPQDTWTEYRNDVLRALRDHFGSDRVVNRNKCITVASAGSSGIAADVVPAFGHRLYVSPDSYVEGIAFRTQREDRLIVNYPKRHYQNGVAKQKATANEYKPTVRIFKNARSHLVEAGALNEDVVPPYFVECMVYNVSDITFQATTWQQQFVQVYKFIEGADLSHFFCVNGVTPLFGSTPEQWNASDARLSLLRMAELWDNW